MKIYSSLSEIQRKSTQEKKRTSGRSKSQQAPAEHIDFTTGGDFFWQLRLQVCSALQAGQGYVHCQQH